MMKISEIRSYALSLQGTIEKPHHQSTSFRIENKIFATIPPGDEYLHVMINEEERELAIALYPENCEKLWWGKKVFGLKIMLNKASTEQVKELLNSAWLNKSTN